MDTLNKYRQIIETILTEYTKIPYAYGDIRTESAFDRSNDRYLLVNVGWDNKGNRIHGTLVHIDILNGKLWIQRDGTEHGIAKELVKAGIPKDHIVLGFHSAEIRQHTDYAAA
ncbi:MAG: XisI protein [Candidatus Aminicenantes bacterium]|nr:XisI protein [Candidatus Aminicenantes bacterium]NIM79280.1 XisI protein [Candidatus Aminicenantes bacterium]NIN18566.1 XisI protein [Candidatus Aminicenantes bacterium]NIN42463.1 XisI protein [Candidatus Aminicenantes bacterium]NIN85221.1 XisI protein [Candidatus Aminicenantes bacterium]